jgi:hypothetical protein
MITQKDRRRGELLFIPALVGKRCQILEWKKDLLMAATRTVTK